MGPSQARETTDASMSDTATEIQPTETAAPATETPQAPPVAETTPAPTPTPEAKPEPTGPLGRREARAAARARAGEVSASLAASRTAEAAAPEPPPVSVAPESVDTDTTATEVVVDEKGRKHDPATGQFLPENGETQGQPEAPAADTRAADAQPDPKPAEERATGISVPIDPKHPIRGMGLEAFTASNPTEEQALRALLNGTYSRRQEVEALQTKLDQERRLRIQLESSQAATQKWQQTPEYKAAVDEYNLIADTAGEDAANRYWRGIQGDLQALQRAEFDERMGAVTQEATAEAGQAWLNEAWGHTAAMPTEIRSLPEFQRWFQEEVEVFDTLVERGRYDHIRRSVSPQEFGPALHREFAAVLRRRIAAEPTAAAVIRKLNAPPAPPAAPVPPAAPAPSAEEQARREAEIRREAVEDFKRQSLATRTATPPHPMGSLANATRDGQVGGAGEEEVDTSAMSPEHRRRFHRAQARKSANAHFTR